ncbi:MAG TPA: Type 1 glutamine amidotransferase-like domain-containing protein [Acidimicrobiales bacterium]|nr:Type 1 glutamine amidotransferase-like domain-containing protein [Acidimicrobiales bacterium]
MDRVRLAGGKDVCAKGARVNLLLTSAGIKNTSIRGALVEMLGQPIEESSALCIPTASYARPGGTGAAWRFIAGRATTPMCELDWKSLGVLELATLPSIDRDVWYPTVQATDAILVNGGDPMYLSYWMKESGFADVLASHYHGVYVGLSAGSMVLAPHVGEDFVQWRPPEGGDTTLGLVEFSIFPHLDHPDMPTNSMTDAEQWASTLPGPAYALDDQSAIRVVDHAVDVVSEGHWRYFPR